MQRNAYLVDLEKCCQMRLLSFSQLSIQPRSLRLRKFVRLSEQHSSQHRWPECSPTKRVLRWRPTRPRVWSSSTRSSNLVAANGSRPLSLSCQLAPRPLAARTLAPSRVVRLSASSHGISAEPPPTALLCASASDSTVSVESLLSAVTSPPRPSTALGTSDDPETEPPTVASSTPAAARMKA